MIEDLTTDELCNDLKEATVAICTALADYQRKETPRAEKQNCLEFLRREATPGLSRYLDARDLIAQRLKRAPADDALMLSDVFEAHSTTCDEAIATVSHILENKAKRERRAANLSEKRKHRRRRMKNPARIVVEYAGVSLTTALNWDINKPSNDYPTRDADLGVLIAWCTRYKNSKAGTQKPGRKPGTGNQHLNSRHLRGDHTDLIVDPSGPQLPARKSK